MDDVSYELGCVIEVRLMFLYWTSADNSGPKTFMYYVSMAKLHIIGISDPLLSLCAEQTLTPCQYR
jgi:hypothetical protein